MKFRDSAALAGFSALQQLVRVVPFPVAVDIARSMGRQATRFFPRERRIAEAQFNFVSRAARTGVPVTPVEVLALHDSVFPPRRLAQITDSTAFVQSVFGHVFESAIETLRIRTLLRRDEQTGNFFSIETTGQEHVAEVMRQGRGCVTVSGHIGCFDLLAAFHVRWGAKVSVIGRDPNYESLQVMVRKLRHNYGVATIWRDDAAAAKQWMSALKENRVVAVLIDQDVALKNDFTPFLGCPAAYPITPIRMAIKREVPILASFILRTGKLRHHVITSRLNYDPNDPRAAENVLVAFNAILEDLICRFPEQWIWWHRRWRRRPGIDYDAPAKPRSIESYIEWLENGAIDETTEKTTTKGAEQG